MPDLRTNIAAELPPGQYNRLTAADTPAANGDDFDLVTWLVIMEP